MLKRLCTQWTRCRLAFRSASGSDRHVGRLFTGRRSINAQEGSMRVNRLPILGVAAAAALSAAALVGVVSAQGAKATINDPVGPLPDPTHIPIVLPADIKWNGQEGRQQQAVLFGDQSKPG